MQLPFPPRSTGNKETDRLYLKVFRFANRAFNYGGFQNRPRVTLNRAYRGGLSGFGSVLYDPSDEFCSPTEPFQSVMDQADLVQREVAKDPGFKMVRGGEQLAHVVCRGEKIAVFHCLEGGSAVEHCDNVCKLADKGVA